MVAELNQQNINSGQKKVSDDLSESYKTNELYKTNILSPVNAINWLMNTKYKLGYPSNKMPLARESDCFGIIINYVYLTTGKFLPDVESGNVNFSNYKELYLKDRNIVLAALTNYFEKYFISIPILHRFFGDVLWTYAKHDDGSVNYDVDDWALGIDCGNGQMMTTSEKDGPVVIQLDLYTIKNVYRYPNGQ